MHPWHVTRHSRLAPVDRTDATDADHVGSYGYEARTAFVPFTPPYNGRTCPKSRSLASSE